MTILKLSVTSLLFLLTCAICANAYHSSSYTHRLEVGMTLVKNVTARVFGAYCLDGSLPAYHVHRGFGRGARNWILQFEGGGWCNDVESCMARSITRRGSTHYMTKVEIFNGILSNNPSLNPANIVDAPNYNYSTYIITSSVPGPTNEATLSDTYYFYNWNRVKIRYCDGASFAGNSKFDNGTSRLYFRGQKIWQAIIFDLLPKGLAKAEKALLGGCSAGGLATFLHCDNFTRILPKNATVKCLSDAGFFLDTPDIAMKYTIRSFYHGVISLQGVEQNLDPNCTNSLEDPKLCFFPQHLLTFIKTPFFILNTAYDVFQFHNILVPSSADLRKEWDHCKSNLTKCTASQIQTLQGFRQNMLDALYPFYRHSTYGGMFINSCFAHCQSEGLYTWFFNDSPIVHNKTIAQAVGDWYFERDVTMLIDCPYPCNSSCKNLIPS